MKSVLLCTLAFMCGLFVGSDDAQWQWKNHLNALFLRRIPLGVVGTDSVMCSLISSDLVSCFVMHCLLFIENIHTKIIDLLHYNCLSTYNTCSYQEINCWPVEKHLVYISEASVSCIYCDVFSVFLAENSPLMGPKLTISSQLLSVAMSIAWHMLHNLLVMSLIFCSKEIFILYFH